jgi:hypothetical protein
MSYYPPPLPPQLAIPAGVVDPQGFVTTDLPCRKCSYNLRGLTMIGRCPECGAAVGLSVQGDLLRFSNPLWVRTLQGGIKNIIYGIAVIFLGAIVGAVVSVAQNVAGPILMFGAIIGGYILILVGTWRLTEPDPSGLGEDQYGTSRKLIRITLLLGVVNQVLDLIHRFSPPPPPISTALTFLSFLFAIAGIVGLFAQLQYLKTLAFRIPDMKLAGRAQFLMYALGISYGAFIVIGAAMALLLALGGPGAAPGGGGAMQAIGCSAAIAGLAFLVFAIIYLLMLERMGKRFGQEAQAAEETWARADATRSNAATPALPPVAPA